MVHSVGNVSFEAKVSRKRLISIPKAAAKAVGISEGMRVRITVENGKLVIEPVKDAIWYALHGPKIGYIGLKELEEESIREQEELKDSG